MSLLHKIIQHFYSPELYVGAARPGVVEGECPPPASENFKAAFSDFGEESFKFSPNLGQNIF